MLFWNGEVFGGLHVPDEQNDGTVLMDHLNMIEFIDTSQYFQEVSDLFKKIEGPYAFVLFNTKHQVLIYGRDSLGRRSLLLHNDNTKFCISSVSIKGMGEWKEIPSSQFCLFDVNARKNLDVIEYSKYDPVSFQINHKENPDFKRILFDLLLDSVRKRLVSIPKVENGSRIAILFSGGLDCSILAALVDKCIPSEESVDLINVAFENQRFLRNHPGTAVFDVPDRISGRESLKCIQNISSREWKFIEVNVKESEIQEHIGEIRDLMHPSNTIMDESICLAFWFASRGIGFCNGRRVLSTANVQFSGVGADELFAGYSRHRAQYYKNGWNGLRDELQRDFDRIPWRNLGRDDRCISDNGKEARFPYLDEEFVKFSLKLPLNLKADFDSMDGKLKDKIILREIAFDLGIKYSSALRKRAIQFGSRTAKRYASKDTGDEKINI